MKVNDNSIVAVYSCFSHYSWGRMLAVTYPDGERVSYGYDCGGKLCLVSGDKGGIPYSYVLDVQYDLFGNRTAITYGNLCQTDYTYDDLQRLAGLRTSAFHAGTAATVQSLSYTFDAAGGITAVENSAPPCGTLGGGYTNHYQYDGISRLTGATQSYGFGSTLSCSYSASGRLCGRNQTHTGQDALYGYDKDNKPHAPRRIIDGHTVSNLLWDACGNLAQASTHDAQDGSMLGCRHLLWTEDGRLTGVVDDRCFSYYAYDHAGERALKLTGESHLLDNNAETSEYYTTPDKVTLYTSPYLVASDKGYTKHYYAGSERICARIGNGGLDHLGNLVSVDPQASARAQALFDACADGMTLRQLDANTPDNITAACGDTPEEMGMGLEPVGTGVHVMAEGDIGGFLAAMDLYSGMTQQQEDPYFCHPDHLGSASWITDRTGEPVQHLQYLPFGEPFVNQRAPNSTYEERFTFTGKERDEETGYSYHGARYYDPKTSGLWLSVDPMADKYPGINPYAYCAWNPVKLVDPDGMKFDSASLQYIEQFRDKTKELINQSSNSSQIKELQSALNELIALEGSDQLYTIKETSGRLGRTRACTYYDLKNNLLTMEFDLDYANLAHELKHAYQFEKKELSFDFSGNFGILYDINDEIAAHKRGAAYDETKGMSTQQIKNNYYSIDKNGTYHYWFVSPNEKGIQYKRNCVKMGRVENRNINWLNENNFYLGSEIIKW